MDGILFRKFSLFIFTQPFAFYFGGDLWALGEPVEILVNGNAERRQHGEIPIHGVRVKTFARHGDIVKAARAFAGFVEADEEFSAREPREDAAAQEALEINDEIEFLRAQPADAGEHFRPVTRFVPAAAFKADDAGEIWIAFEQRRERTVNPPENFSLWIMQFQQTQHGQRLKNVAERAGFENENFQKSMNYEL